MKKIEAIIRPHKLDEVKDHLLAAGVQGMTVLEVQGSDGEPSQIEFYRGTPYVTAVFPKIKLEIIVQDHLVAAVVETIENAARTDSVIGDGTIVVVPIEDVVRIRTGEHGRDALEPLPVSHTRRVA